MGMKACAFCGEGFIEGDDVTRAMLGVMTWSDQSGMLYADPLLTADGEWAEHWFHSLCFHDGPERSEEDMISVPYAPEGVFQPYCAVCEEDLQAGDNVYMVQIGNLHCMDFTVRELGRLHDGDYPVLVVAVYSHCECVDRQARAWMPAAYDGRLTYGY